MQDKLEKIAKMAYEKWLAQEKGIFKEHPDEEAFACFFEGKLPQAEEAKLKAHLIKCNACAELVVTQARLSLQDKAVPGELVENAKKLLAQEPAVSILEIFLKGLF